MTIKNGEYDKARNVFALDSTASLRPTKIAFLIDSRTSLNWMSSELIPWMCTTWGGAHSALIVLKDDKSHNVPHFSAWMDLLAKFDPDYIISTAHFSSSLIDTIKSYCLCRSDIFQYNIGAVNFPCMINSGDHYTTSIEPIISQEPNLNINEFQVSGCNLTRAVFYSKFGRIGKFITAYRKSGFVVSNKRISARDALLWVDERTFRIFDKRPDLGNDHISRSMRHLGNCGARGWIHDFDFSNTIIVGDTVADMSLYMTLRLMIPKVHWIPASLSHFEEPSLHNFFLDLIFNINNQKAAIITSASLRIDQLKIILFRAKYQYHTHSNSSRAVKFITMTELIKSLNNWSIWGEGNNQKDETLVFSTDKCLQKLPTLIPKNFKSLKDNINFWIDVSIHRYAFLANTLCNISPAEWSNQRSVLSSDCRRNATGGVSFYPLRHLRISGQDIQSLLHSPRLVHRDLFAELEDLFRTIGKTPNKSHGNKNIFAAAALWNHSLDAFYTDYQKNDTSRIFSVFKAKGDSQRKNIGLQSGAGIKIKGDYFCFSGNFLNAFNPILTSFSTTKLSEWLRSEILIRGERLKCSRCGFIDFYSEAIVSRYFSCKRCGDRVLRDIDSMGNIEPRYLYDINPVIRGLHENNSDLILIGASLLKNMSKCHFAFEAEIELIVQGTSGTRVEKEIDIFANIDGNLVIGEAKSNGELSGTQLQTYVDLCKQTHATIFCMISRGKVNNQTKSNITGAFSSHPNIDVYFIET
jgi:hypothetical protein